MSNETMTDARALADRLDFANDHLIGGAVHHAAIKEAAARLRGEAAQGEQQAVAWIRFCSDGLYEGPIHDSRMEDVRRHSGAWTPLYTRPQPAAVAGDAVRESLDTLATELRRLSVGTPSADKGALADLADIAKGAAAALAAAPAAPAPVAGDAVATVELIQTFARAYKAAEPGAHLTVTGIDAGLTAALAQDRASQAGAAGVPEGAKLIAKLRGYFEEINADDDGDHYLNISYDALKLIDAALRTGGGES